MINEYPGSLHNHTDYSNLRLRDCINKIDTLIDYAIELGHQVVAITDHETISNAVKIEQYYKKIKKEHPDFKVIRGNEIYLVRNGLNNSNFNREFDRYYHFILLAKDEIGFKQLCEISTRAWMRSYMSRRMRRVPTYYQDLFDIVGTNPGHLIASTACLGGTLPTQILRAQKNPELLPKIENWILRMKELFGEGNFFFEMQPSHNHEQVYVNKVLLDYSRQYNVPYIITTDSHYLKKEDRLVHKAYLNSQNGDREVDEFYATTYMMNTKELESYFSYFSKEELSKAYENICFIKDSCQDYSILKPLKIPQLPWNVFKNKDNPEDYYEKIPCLKTFMESDYIGDKQLCYAVVEGIEKHTDLQNQEAYDEINSNLEMTWISSNVNKTHWSAYYLNLQKIIDECWNSGTIVGPGRGSGVGFILLYVLDITQINPLREKTRCFSWRSRFKGLLSIVIYL